MIKHSKTTKKSVKKHNGLKEKRKKWQKNNIIENSKHN